MATNNFRVFAEDKSNMMSDQNYATNAQRTGGVAAGVADVALHNKLYHQATMMAAALGEYIAGKGIDATDDDLNKLKQAIESAFHHTGELMVATGLFSFSVPALNKDATYTGSIINFGKTFPDAGSKLFVGIQCAAMDWVRSALIPWAASPTTTGFTPTLKNVTGVATESVTYYGKYLAVWSL